MYLHMGTICDHMRENFKTYHGMQPNDQQIIKMSRRSSYETITHSWLIDKIDFIPCIVHIENTN